jgi:hypothetical protein
LSTVPASSTTIQKRLFPGIYPQDLCRELPGSPYILLKNSPLDAKKICKQICKQERFRPDIKRNPTDSFKNPLSA